MMYSPKIAEHLIPQLYWLARARGVPMTRLVAEILEAHVALEAETIEEFRNPQGTLVGAAGRTA